MRSLNDLVLVLRMQSSESLAILGGARMLLSDLGDGDGLLVVDRLGVLSVLDGLFEEKRKCNQISFWLETGSEEGERLLTWTCEATW